MKVLVNQYICADYICLSSEQGDNITDFERKFMFVIDVYSVYKYDVCTQKLIKIFDLDEVKSKSDIVTKMKKAIV